MKITTGEKVKIDSILMMLYGEVGIGKTSLAISSKRPLAIDTEKGLRRSEFRAGVPTLQVEKADELLEATSGFEKDFKEFDTIIIDTVDALLEKFREYIERQDYSLKRNTLRMYGQLKDQFNLFLTRLMLLNKDIILVAHASTEEINGIIRTTPKITGGSKELIKQRTDFIGYLFSKNNERHLTFDPTDYYDAKNSCQLPEYIIPDFHENPRFLDIIISEAKLRMELNAETELKDNEIIKGFISKIEKLSNVFDCNDLVAKIGESELSKSAKNFVFKRLDKKAKELDKSVKFKRSKMLYVAEGSE